MTSNAINAVLTFLLTAIACGAAFVWLVPKAAVSVGNSLFRQARARQASLDAAIKARQEYRPVTLEEVANA